MANVDISKVFSIPELYAFLREKVPGGRLAAPVVMWLAIMTAMVLMGGIIWKGLGMPTILIARGGMAAIPAGQLGTSLVAAVLLAMLAAFAQRSLRDIPGLVRSIVDLQQQTLEFTRNLEQQAHERNLERIENDQLLSQATNSGLIALLERIDRIEAQMASAGLVKRDSN
jgi:hypothetical protein